MKTIVRSDYISIIDREKLQYLNGFEKIGCMYCGYANGVMIYRAEIAHQTEQYRCGIMHKDTLKGKEYQKELDFAAFGDKADYEKKYE